MKEKLPPHLQEGPIFRTCKELVQLSDENKQCKSTAGRGAGKTLLLSTDMHTGSGVFRAVGHGPKKTCRRKNSASLATGEMQIRAPASCHRTLSEWPLSPTQVTMRVGEGVGETEARSLPVGT